jgi:perosamine synthetase
MGDLSWRFDDREFKYIKEVLDSGFASGTSGSMNTRLERRFAEKIGRRFAITFNSGTTTLHTALWALGVRYGDEVILPPLTVISCMNAVLYCNAIPVFADIDPDTFLLDPADIRRKITSRTKAIIPVHLYGQVCNMTEIMSIAREHNLGVVEDCAQCYIGTHQGKIGGSMGDIGSWSFENSKHLTTGDGGIIACDNEALGDRIRKLNSQGFKNATAKNGKIRISKDLFQNPTYTRHSIYGFMYRLPEVCAAMGLAQLEKLDYFVQKREKMATMYREVIESTGCQWLIPQATQKGDRNSYYTYAAKYLKSDVPWTNFRKKHVENGGDGCYAAWALCYQEESIPEIKEMLSVMNLKDRLNTSSGICPNAEQIQPSLMQFTTNQNSDAEMQAQSEALYDAIRYYS